MHLNNSDDCQKYLIAWAINPPTTQQPDRTNAIIAQTQESKPFQLAWKCNQLGLFRSRLVRTLFFGFKNNEEKIASLQKALRSLPQAQQDTMRDAITDLLNKNWHVKKNSPWQKLLQALPPQKEPVTSSQLEKTSPQPVSPDTITTQSQEKPSGFITFNLDTLRDPPVSITDASVINQEGKVVYVQKIERLIDNENKDILICQHPIQFLPSPYQEQSTEERNELISRKNPIIQAYLEKDLANRVLREQALAITENGKHVLLQQSHRSCVPTAVAMLVLDNGKNPNYDSLVYTDITNWESACKWIQEAGLKPCVTDIPKANEKRGQFLEDKIKQGGPAWVNISHPKLGGHVVVLDEVSVAKNQATIRDPYHGWMITITLDGFLSWDPSKLIQIEKSDQ